MSKTEYPKRVWHPEEGHYIDVKAEHEIPEGFLDRHPNDPNAKLVGAPPVKAPKPKKGEKVEKIADVPPPPPSVEPPQSGSDEFSGGPPPDDTAQSDEIQYDRAEVISELKARGLQFNSRAPTKDLVKLLGV